MPARKRKTVEVSVSTKRSKPRKEPKENSKGDTSSNSTVDHKENRTLLNNAYGLSFPQDFFDLWDFCKEVNPTSPRSALTHTLNFELVGPYEVLSKELVADEGDKFKLHMHWRFYFDPPEFMTTIISKDKREATYHVGYWRDDPKNDKCVVARTSDDNWAIAILGDNIFYEIRHRLDCRLTTAKGKELKAKLKQLKESLIAFCECRGINMDSQLCVKERAKTIVAPGLHGAGLVVPLDENEVGYRPVGETRSKLMKMFKNIDEAPNDDIRMDAFDPLQELIRYVQLGNDECDFGMGLELGMAMFCYGSKYLNKAACRMLSMAYSLLKRDLFGKIIECHLMDRRREKYARFPS